MRTIFTDGFSGEKDTATTTTTNQKGKSGNSGSGWGANVILKYATHTEHTFNFIFLDSYKRELRSLRRIKYRLRDGKQQLYIILYHAYNTN